MDRPCLCTMCTSLKEILKRHPRARLCAFWTRNDHIYLQISCYEASIPSSILCLQWDDEDFKWNVGVHVFEEKFIYTSTVDAQQKLVIHKVVWINWFHKTLKGEFLFFRVAQHRIFLRILYNDDQYKLCI
jgi:hypothetical protein